MILNNRGRYNKGNRLARVRRCRGLGQSDLASLGNLAIGSISRLENGEDTIQIRHIFTMAGVLNCDVNVLLEDTPYEIDFRNLVNRLGEFHITDSKGKVLMTYTPDDTLGEVWEHNGAYALPDVAIDGISKDNLQALLTSYMIKKQTGELDLPSLLRKYGVLAPELEGAIKYAIGSAAKDVWSNAKLRKLAARYTHELMFGIYLMKPAAIYDDEDLIYLMRGAIARPADLYYCPNINLNMLGDGAVKLLNQPKHFAKPKCYTASSLGQMAIVRGISQQELQNILRSDMHLATAAELAEYRE